MVSKILPDAMKAYQAAGKSAEGAPMDARFNAGPSFTEFLKDGLETAINAQRASETMSAKFVDGKADLHDVVNAISNAEATLNTVIAIRDKVIQAYQEIMRMPI